MIIEPQDIGDGKFRLSFEDGRRFWGVFYQEGQTHIYFSQITMLNKPLRIAEGRLSVGGVKREAFGSDSYAELLNEIEDRGMLITI